MPDVSRETPMPLSGGRSLFCEWAHLTGGPVQAKYRFALVKNDKERVAWSVCRRHVTAWLDFTLEKDQHAIITVSVLR